MSKSFRLLLVLARSLLVMLYSVTAATAIRGQTMPTSPSPLISVLPATAANLPQLDNAVVAKFHPNAFVISNNASRDVVGLVVIWTYTDVTTGKAAIHYMNSDSFMQPTPRNVITAGTRLLVAPGVFLPEAMVSTAHLGPTVGNMDGSLVREMQGATNMAVKIDALIFSDGEVTGPNESRYDSQIENRKMAAVAIAKQVRNAMAKGQDPKTVLVDVLASQPAREDSLGRWRVNYAQMLARARNLDKTLDGMETLPDPPKFFHK
jgi:hypothetical protein